MCPRITKSLYYMYTKSQMMYWWDNELSDYFNGSNVVKKGGVISPLLFSCYFDNLFSQLQHSGLGCNVGLSYTVAFGYADDIDLLAHSLQCLKNNISICEEYTRSHSITFDPNKSKLLCYNKDLTGVVGESRVTKNFQASPKVSILQIWLILCIKLILEVNMITWMI